MKQDKEVVPVEEWKWFGLPAHFIGGNQCRFHLATQVGKYLISTVGEYFSESTGTREMIGSARYLETMVFKAGKPCNEPSCNCGLPRLARPFNELDFEGYNTAGEAQVGHMKYCHKWAGRKK